MYTTKLNIYIVSYGAIVILCCPILQIKFFWPLNKTSGSGNDRSWGYFSFFTPICLHDVFDIVCNGQIRSTVCHGKAVLDDVIERESIKLRYLFLNVSEKFCLISGNITLLHLSK